MPPKPGIHPENRGAGLPYISGLQIS